MIPSNCPFCNNKLLEITEKSTYAHCEICKTHIVRDFYRIFARDKLPHLTLDVYPNLTIIIYAQSLNNEDNWDYITSIESSISPQNKDKIINKIRNLIPFS